MKPSRFLYLILSIIIIASLANAYPDEHDLFLYQKIQRALFNDDFPVAYDLSDSLINSRPHDLSGHLFKAATYLAEMTYNEENLNHEQFFQRLNTIDNLFKINIQTTDSTYLAWQYLWRGHARAYLSLWESRFGSVTSAIKQGINARNDYQKGLEYDSSCYDLYGGLGMYHYWKSVKAGFLTSIGIFNDDAQRGIDELYLTLDSSRISRTTARNALIWIYLDQKKYDSVLIICDQLLAEYPNGTMYHWPTAQAFYEIKLYKGAIAVYETLRDIIVRHPGNYFNLIECDYQLIKCYNELGDYEGRDEVVKQFKDYYRLIELQTKNRQNSKIAYIKRYF